MLERINDIEIISILLKRLRLDLNLVYSLSISINTDDCGTTLSISTETIDKNAKKVISEIFRLIKKYKKTLLTKEKIENTKRTWIMSINNICLTKPQEVSEY
ncbi:MAG: insulinase family protein, partial [Flavobacteriales bacterium]|nr:insulinase family protein [Flavobacteriales bacterium]